MIARTISLFRDELGNTVVEYALILSLIAVTCLLGVTVLGTGVKSQLTQSSTLIAAASTGH